ncbi:MAG: hypothetical protein KBF32_01645 [Chitinophagales bacterium]|nr:hypothetical protein [Chitinophagales bacterium]
MAKKNKQVSDKGNDKKIGVPKDKKIVKKSTFDLLLKGILSVPSPSKK